MSDNFNNQAEWKVAEKMYEKAAGGEDLSNFLNAISVEERVGIAKKMQSISDLRSNDGLPALTIEFETDMQGNEHLTDVHKQKWGPDKDVYNMPGGHKATDTLADERVNQSWNDATSKDGFADTTEKQLAQWDQVQKLLSITVPERLGK